MAYISVEADDRIEEGPERLEFNLSWEQMLEGDQQMVKEEDLRMLIEGTSKMRVANALARPVFGP